MIATFAYEVTMITPGLRQMPRHLVSKGVREAADVTMSRRT
jgi:hypothetical protein